MNTAQRGSARLERMEPCARSRWAVSEEQRPTCLPHPRGARCAEALFGPYCLGAGCWRCPRQVGRGNSPAHSKWFFSPLTLFCSAVAMGYQGGCHGLPDRGSGSVRGMAGACGLLSRGPQGWGLSYKEGPGKRRKSTTRYTTQSLPASAVPPLFNS